MPGLVPLLAVLLAAHAPVVAGPTKSGVKLVAFDRGSALCTEVRGSEEYDEPDCGRPAPSVRNFPFEISSSRKRTVATGLVAPEVATVDLVFRGGRHVRAPTSAGEDYQGRYAGRLRFVLAEWRGLRDDGFDEPLYARMLDAQGELLAVVDLAYEGVRIGPRTTVARGRVGSTRWSLVAFKRRFLASLPGNEERFVEATCVAFEDGSGFDVLDEHVPRAEVCRDPEGPTRGWDMNLDHGCQPIGNAVVGIAPPSARRVVAVLGDGRRVGVPIVRLPGRLGGERAFALGVDRRTALRRLVARGPGGRKVLASGVAPGVLQCPWSSSAFLIFTSFDLAPSGQRSGALAFQMIDRGVLICPSLVGPPRPRDCVRPPIDERQAIVLTHPTDAATAVVGVVPAHVAAVVLGLDGDERVRLPTTLSGPYTGQYAGRLRFFSVLLPGRRRVEWIRPIDDHGRRLELQGGPDLVAPLERPHRVLARLAGGYRLGATTWDFDDERELCLQLARGAFSPSPFACRGGSTFLDFGVEVPCAPRRTLIWGRLPRGAHAVYGETSAGRIDGRVLELPRGLHVRGRAFVLALPARARPTELMFPGARKPRLVVRIPAAAQQCGWGDSLLTYRLFRRA